MTAPGNYHQEKVKELLKRVLPMGPIGNVMLQTIKEVLPPSERIIACFYLLDYSEASLGAGEQPTFYASVVQLLTTQRFVDLGFYPKYHSQRVLAVSGIGEVRLENTFVTGFEGEEASAEATGFRPLQTKLSATLLDPAGRVLDTWMIEATRPEQIDNVLEIHRSLSRVVGRPLAEDLQG